MILFDKKYTRYYHPLIFIAFFLFCSHFTSQAQKVDLNKKISLTADTSLSYILDQISRQSDILFAINHEQINDQQKVKIAATNESVTWILEKVCSQLGLQYTVVEKQVIISRKGEHKKKDLKPPTFTVSGNIKDKATGDLLIGAVVVAEELTQGTVTNPYGFYSITLPEGNYTLEYSYLGYDKRIETIQLNKDTGIYTELPERKLAFREVVVMPTLTGISPGSAPISFKAITIEEMPGFMGETEIIKSLQTFPGIKSHGDGSVFFYVRGGNKDQNLVLIDEAPVYNPSHLFGFFSSFIPEAIKDVKVYKNDIPLNIGGRLSSVIDIKTREGNMKRFGFQGSLGIASNRFIVEGPIKKDKLSYFVSLRKSNFGQKLLERGGFNFHDLNIKLNYQINENNRVYLSGYNGKDDYRVPGSETGHFGINWLNSTLTLRWNHVFNNKLFSNTTFHTSKYEYNLIISERNGQFWNETITNGTLKTDLNYYYNPSNTFKFGININGHFFNPGNLSKGFDAGIPFIPQKNVRQAILYLSTNKQIGDKLSIRYGARFNIWQNTGPTTEYLMDSQHRIEDTLEVESGKVYHTYRNLEPRISASYKIDSFSTLKAGYERTLQYIQLLSNSISPFTTLDVWVPSGPNIQPQKADQFSAGYSRRFGKNQFELSAEAYYKRMYDQIEFRDHPDLFLNPLVDQELRFGKAWSYGAELLLKKPAGRLKGQVGYSYSRVFKKIEEINKGKRYPAIYDRPHQLTFAFSYDLSERWQLLTNWIYTSGAAITTPTGFYYYGGKSVPVYESRNNDRLPDYHRLDIGAIFNLNKTDEKRYRHHLKFNIFNVYGRKNPFALNFNKTGSHGKIVVPQNVLNNSQLLNTQIYLLGTIPSISYNFKF